jgi:hypothetical protein
MAAATAIPSTLRAAAALIGVEALVEAVVIARRSELVPGFRVCLLLVLSLKVLWAIGALRLRAGAALGLFMIEGVSALAALGATDAALGARLALAAAATTAIALVAASLHAFPDAPLP